MGRVRKAPGRAEEEERQLEQIARVGSSGPNGDSSPTASDSPSPVKAEVTSSPNEDSSPAASDSPSPVQPQVTSSPNEDSSPAASDSPSPGKAVAASPELLSAVKSSPTPLPELPTPERFEPSRDAKSPNGFRHLSLLMQEGSRLVFQTDPNGLAAEQFRLLRGALSKEFDAGAVLLITSPGMGDGKTLTSVNLCSCLAETGNPTLLVEVDVRRPAIREILSCGIEPPGLEDALAEKVEPSKAVYGIKELNLYAAMVAKIPENPSQLMSGPGVKHFLTWAREQFLWVVLDAPPVLPAADVPELLPFADAALLVIRAQSTPRDLTKRAIEMLGKHLRGVIFNEVTVDSDPRYRYLSHYYSQKLDVKSAGRVR